MRTRAHQKDDAASAHDEALEVAPSRGADTQWQRQREGALDDGRRMTDDDNNDNSKNRTKQNTTIKQCIGD